MNRNPAVVPRSSLTRGEFLRLGAGLTGAALLGAAGCGVRGAGQGGGGGGGGDEFTIRLSHVVTADDPKGKASQKFKEVLEKSTEGRITVEIYPNSELYGDEDEIQAVQSGGVEMIAPASSKLTDIARQLLVLDLPFIVDDTSEVPDLISRDSTVGKGIYTNKDLADNNIKVMGLWDNGLYQITSNKAVRKPDDLRGQRIRITPSDAIQAYWNKWGAKTTPMAFAEVFTALQQGVVDGEFNTYSNIESQRFYEVQKYITISDHGYLTYVLAMNNKFFNSLPDDLQQAVVEAVDEASAYNREIADTVNQEARKVIEEAGTSEIIELSSEDRQAFKDAVVPSIWNQFADDIGQDIIDELLARKS
ncbi:MAG: DctP family TRAP transporter solute-binding subunit [Streptosporangiales bacterium]|nr:DctP family TRAP transporter solute-binding subunit [Streptosporangiales bacterium]